MKAGGVRGPPGCCWETCLGSARFAVAAVTSAAVAAAAAAEAAVVVAARAVAVAAVEQVPASAVAPAPKCAASSKVCGSFGWPARAEGTRRPYCHREIPLRQLPRKQLLQLRQVLLRGCCLGL